MIYINGDEHIGGNVMMILFKQKPIEFVLISGIDASLRRPDVVHLEGDQRAGVPQGFCRIVLGSTTQARSLSPTLRERTSKSI